MEGLHTVEILISTQLRTHLREKHSHSNTFPPASIIFNIFSLFWKRPRMASLKRAKRKNGFSKSTSSRDAIFNTKLKLSLSEKFHLFFSTDNQRGIRDFSYYVTKPHFGVKYSMILYLKDKFDFSILKKQKVQKHFLFHKLLFYKLQWETKRKKNAQWKKK